MSKSILRLNRRRSKAHGRTLIHDVIEPSARVMRGDELVSPTSPLPRNGGAGRDRTDDLKLAKLPLSQLSYGPDLPSHYTQQTSGRPGQI